MKRSYLRDTKEGKLESYNPYLFPNVASPTPTEPGDGNDPTEPGEGSVPSNAIFDNSGNALTDFNGTYLVYG